jgi:hypothetical protein
MISAFLRALKARGFRIVHVVPPDSGRPISATPAHGRRG